MRIKRTTPTSGITRRSRLIAVTTGLVAAAAFAIPHANAADSPTFSTAQLKSAGDAVLQPTSRAPPGPSTPRPTGFW